MKKSRIFFVIIICLIVVFALTGCNKSEKQNNEGAVQTSNNNYQGYSVKYKDYKIVLGSEFNEKAIDEKANLSEVQSCAFDGIDKIYTYSGIELTVSPIDGKDKVYSVYFIDDSVETEEGVKLSDSKQAMIDKYGENYSLSTGNRYTYTKGDVELSFIIESEVITSIEYVLKV